MPGMGDHRPAIRRNKWSTDSKRGATGDNYPTHNRLVVGVVLDSRKSRTFFPGSRLSCLVNIHSINRWMLILFKICTVGLHSVFCIHSLASGRVACWLFVIILADLWINTVQLQHDVGRSSWRRHWTMCMPVVLIDVCSIGIVNRYVCQLNFASLWSGFYHWSVNENAGMRGVKLCRDRWQH